MKQRELAAALGLSPAAVSRLVARGMPTDSPELAHAWRREHVRPRMKPFPRVPAGGPVMTEGAMLRRVSTLAAMGAEALAGGAGFELIEPELRAALAALPDELRERVLYEWPAGHPEAPAGDAAAALMRAGPCAVVPLAVMDALTAAVRAVIEADQAGAPAGGAALGDDEAEAMGRFWFRVAAGEIVPAAR